MKRAYIHLALASVALTTLSLVLIAARPLGTLVAPGTLREVRHELRLQALGCRFLPRDLRERIMVDDVDDGIEEALRNCGVRGVRFRDK